MYDSGTITVRRGVDVTPPGGMPEIDYQVVWSSYYSERTVGVTRWYNAQQYDSRADLLIRVPRIYSLNVESDVVRLSPYSHKDKSKYLIIQIQHVLDEDGLPASDLTLQKTEVEDGEIA